MAAIHETMESLFEVGAIDKQTMREFDDACLTAIEPLTPRKSFPFEKREIRIRDEAGAFRVLYIANIEDAVYVLHSFPEEDAANSETGLGSSRDPFAANLVGA